jgi:L-aminopeptidase/D-esterase-like protein
MYPGTICDIDGVLCGQVSDHVGKTGCTVVIFPQGAVAGVDVRGAAPGTRETDLLRPGNLVDKVHAILLSGGSAFGLDAATGVMRWLEEQGIGFDPGVAKVPIVPAAVLFDLAVGDPKARPDAAMGYAACCSASAQPVEQGAVGAGCGASVGKALGLQCTMKGGIGCASMQVAEATVSVLVAVNAFGDVIDYNNNNILAGAKLPDGVFPGIQSILTSSKQHNATVGTNTTIGIIVTDALLDKAQANRLATVAHDGLAWSIRPVHTALDGDTLFAASCGNREADFHALCATAVETVARAVNNAVEAANHD